MYLNVKIITKKFVKEHYVRMIQHKVQGGLKIQRPVTFFSQSFYLMKFLENDFSAEFLHLKPSRFLFN